MISQLSDGLKEVIELEKRAGNKVVQVDRNWPQCGNCNSPFLKRTLFN